MKSPYIKALNRPFLGSSPPFRKKEMVIGTIGKTQGVSSMANPHRMASRINPQILFPEDSLAAALAFNSVLNSFSSTA